MSREGHVNVYVPVHDLGGRSSSIYALMAILTVPAAAVW
jgi:hypothetical protein